jgi:aminoglycoside phosphotransferase (APT) family kinase protein
LTALSWHLAFGPGAGCQTDRVPREYEPPTPDILQWVAHHVHPRARVTAVAPLPGGITADMDRVSVNSPTGLKDVVLRRWPGEDWADGLVTREASALAAVRGRGVPAPQLLAMDEDGAETGVRCTLTSALTGHPDLSPADMQSWLGQLATTQAAIHAVPDHPQTWWDGWYDDGAPLDWLADRGLRDAAREAASGPLVEEEVLVHGDYQHFNVLWCDDRLSGVVDWPNAATGNRGSDVGHCRLNLAVLFDTRTAGDYLVMYERAAGVRVDRRADCERCSALTSGGSASSRARSPGGLRSTWQGCLVELPPRSAAPWTGSASQPWA